MKLEYEKVETLSLKRLTNAEFIYFITRVVELLVAMQEKEDEGDDGEEDLPSVQSAEPRAAADGVPALYIPQEMIDAVKEALAKMQNLTKESRANAITKQLEIIDRRRDSLAAFVLEAIKRAADMFSEAEELALVLALQTAMGGRHPQAAVCPDNHVDGHRDPSQSVGRRKRAFRAVGVAAQPGRFRH